jgi:geranylgeranyl transferase type-2 subunit beta
VYHTFLAALCHRMLGSEFAGGNDAAAFVLSCRCTDGGFADSARHAAVEGGTNPTAAAVALLAMLGELDEATAMRAARFLASMQRLEGGFAANAAAPTADLLSTFTAPVALAELGGLNLAKLALVARFVQALRAPGGGFRGSADDDAPDVEYTYYGLGTFGLLGWVAARGEQDA